MELKKALYGQLKAALLFYQNFVNNLKVLGFKINPFDPCVANRIIEASQQTISWNVDDVKSSHKSKKVQGDFENWLIDKYDCDKNGKIVGKLKRCVGKRLGYLGMILDYTIPGEVKSI